MPGISVADLTQQDRDNYRQNTGCLVNIVYKNTIAYYANLTHGDIITSINGTKILLSDDFFTFRKNSNIGDVWNITIVRDGRDKEITLTFGLY